MDFIAIDVETANPCLASICQIGVVRYFDGEPVEEWKSLIDPEDFFDQMNMRIHGIGESTVAGAPKFPEIAHELYRLLDDSVVACHGSFDRASILQSCERYKIRFPESKWLDTSRVARHAWEECAHSGYSLRNVCSLLGYEFKHHDALEDAKASAHILISAIKKSGTPLNDWLIKAKQRIRSKGGESSTSSASSTKREGNPDGDFFGDVAVFTGAIGMPRSAAADLASEAGCNVANSVTKATTMLIVGDQDIRALAGHSKSSKQRKAEQLIEEGYPIRILTAADFQKILKTS